MGELSGAEASLQQYLQQFHEYLESNLTGGLWAEDTGASRVEGVAGSGGLLRSDRFQTPREVVGIALGAVVVGVLMLTFLMSV
jgi:hypothetical protein